jgi:predicted metalloprotease with PDZ domain
VLAIATMAAMVFALLNFDQRTRFESPDDGVSWRDTDHGIVAQQVLTSSPGEKVGIHAGDRLLEVSGAPVGRALDVTKKLWRAGLWSQVRYKLARNGEEFETSLVLAPADKPASIENYLRFAGLLYLFIGFFHEQDYRLRINKSPSLTYESHW